MSEEYFTPQEVAERLKISKTTVLANIRSGRWECLQISDRIYRFTEEQFNQITSTPAFDQRPRKMHGGRRKYESELHRALRKIS